jgi:hypothetical protein
LNGNFEFQGKLKGEIGGSGFVVLLIALVLIVFILITKLQELNTIVFNVIETLIIAMLGNA